VRHQEPLAPQSDARYSFNNKGNSMSVESRLKELNIELPKPPAPVASYVPSVASGKNVYISGQVTLAPDGLKYVGTVGKELSLEDGRAAARLCALNVIAQAKAACGGDLERVQRIVKLTVFVNAVAGFTQHPEVANGASDLFVEVFGEAGKHARSAVGAASLPRNVATEVEAIIEIS
jgi:enamine deaminase RidA (YjgF/YER057c/UK114 family)